MPRRGAGTALLDAGLARADAARVGSYLECKAGNVDYYRRFGFELRGEVVIVPGRLTVLTMWRAPARGTVTRPPVRPVDLRAPVLVDRLMAGGGAQRLPGPTCGCWSVRRS